MPAKLLHNSYGKSSVRVTKVNRLADRHELVEMKVDITLQGDFARSYTDGDNSSIIATDSMKNTVYLLAKDHPMDSPESFALHLADHFLKTYAQVHEVEVQVDQSQWRRLEVNGTAHPTAFESAGNEMRTAWVALQRDGKHARLLGGLRELLVLKTTDSEFKGFVRDEFTTLAETSDRILATKVSARWSFTDRGSNFNSAYAAVRRALIEAFARHQSLAVQQTLLAMGEAALDAAPIGDIQLQMPNKHRIPFNFKPFGKEFNNDVFVTTDEPFGEISGLIARNSS